MSITGIGGFFFRAQDPKALDAWYKTHFAIGMGADYTPWQQQAGPTVFMPFPADTDYFPAGKQWKLNLRTDDIDAMMAQLRAAGVEVITDPAWDTPETGRFCKVHDPEGNAVEIWQPPVD